jgi:hypothetical protein
LLPTARPTFSARDVFTACCGTISDAARKARLSPNVDKVEDASAAYAIAGAGGDLQSFVVSTYNPLGTATSDDFDWLYEARLVRSKPGRTYYLQLRDGNGERCALCNVRTATTLDHHLPKSAFSVLSVTPDNLLPSCGECNHTKLAKAVATLNTYFDDLGPGSWLKARIIETTPYVPEFFVESQPSWSPGLASRAQAHFELFGLQKLYAAQANRQIAGIRKFLTGLHEATGMEGVRQHLRQTADSFAEVEPNGWETAVYAAAASSDWFCGGGFKH